AIRSESDTGLNAAISSNGAPIAGTSPIFSVSPDSASPCPVLVAPNVTLMSVSSDQRHPRSSAGGGIHLFRFPGTPSRERNNLHAGKSRLAVASLCADLEDLGGVE